MIRKCLVYLALAAFLLVCFGCDEKDNHLYKDFTKKGQRTPAARPGHVLQQKR